MTRLLNFLRNMQRRGESVFDEHGTDLCLQDALRCSASVVSAVAGFGSACPAFGSLVRESEQREVSRVVLPGKLGKFSIASWNSNGLLGKDPSQSRKKMGYLRRLLNNYDVVMLQELHGTDLACDRLASDFRHTHKVKYSVGPSTACGGIAFFTKLALADRAMGQPSMEVFEAGRAGALRLEFTDGDISVNNIHYFDLKDPRAIVGKVSEYIRRARANVTGTSVAFLGGDFNYVMPGEKAPRVGIDGAAFPTVTNAGTHISRAKIWAPALRNCVELFQGEPTRMGVADNAKGDHYFVASRLARIFASWLPLQHSLLNIKTSAVGAVSYSKPNGSDHIAIGSVIQLKRSVPPDFRPMPRWLAEHDLFEETFNKMAAPINFEDFEPFIALRLIKKLMKKAGSLAKRLAFKKDPSNPSIRMQLILQLARAVAEQDVKLANRVISDLPEIKDMIFADYERVHVVDQDKVDELSQEIARKALDVEYERANHGASRKRPRGGGIAALQRQSLLWSPFAKKAVNVAIVRSDGTIAVEDQEKARELGEFWGKTFSEKLIDKEDAKAFLCEFGKPFELDAIQPPDQNAIERFLRHARHSAPGPDGLPYASWRATTSTGSRVLSRVFFELSSGRAPPEDFNESVGIFPAKGTADDDSSQLVKRAASDTRPLSCKNCDNKTLAGCVNAAMTPSIAKHADDQQEGFVRGRQGLNNVVTIDCLSRVADAKAAAGDNLPIEFTPLLLLFDFAAAFPSLAHEFIFMVLQFYQAPAGMYLFFVALYTDNKCYALFGGVRFFLYCIRSGILQGCPASGSLFVMAIDAFLCMLKAKIAQSRSKAFADDIASILQKLSQLHIAERCFSRFSCISGLKLKPKKCKLIPLGAPLDDARKASVQAYVSRNIPNWKSFLICDSGEYLGFMVGPKGGTVSSWCKPLQKFERLVGELSAAGLAAAAGTDIYKARIATTTAYVEQLCPPSPKYLLLEASAIEKVLHVPHYTLPKWSPYLLDQAGMRSFPCLELRALAAQARTAAKTCTCWREELAELNLVRSDYGPMLNVLSSVNPSRQLQDNAWWSSESFADVLKRASELPLSCNRQPAKTRRSAVQMHAYNELVALRLPHRIANLLLPRLSKHLSNETLDQDKLLHAIDVTLNICKRLTPQVGSAVIRTWCNGWPTSSRVGADTVACIFGCAHHIDSLRHYATCPLLWTPILSECRRRWGTTWRLTVWNSLALGHYHNHNVSNVVVQRQLFSIMVATDVFNTMRAQCKKGPTVSRHVSESFRRYLSRFPGIGMPSQSHRGRKSAATT